MNYDTEEYAASRLNGTLVMHKNVAVKVLDVLPGMIAKVETVIKKIVSDVPINALDVKGMKLGYVNQDNDTVFVVRKPSRRPRQGLTTENMIDVANGGITHVQMGCIANTLANSYPTINSAIAKIGGGAIKCAFSRDFCIDCGWKVEYRGVYTIGELKPDVDKKTHILTLYKQFSYLKERLDDFSKQGLSTQIQS